MSLKLITLAAFAATAQAACDADDSKAMSDCLTKSMEDMTKTPATKDNICAKTQSMLDCYPACYCDDAAYKETIATQLKTSGEQVKTVSGEDCPLTCGKSAGSALAPGMALTLALMVAARLYE